MFRSSPRRRDALAHRYLDMWAFMGLHPCNLEILQKLKMADDQRFGANMDVCGTVKELDSKTSTWAESHIVAIRSDVWHPDHDQQLRTLQRLQSDHRESIKRGIKSRGRLSAEQSLFFERQCEHDPVLKLKPQDIESRRLVLKLFSTTSARTRWTGTIEEVVISEIHNSLGTGKTMLSFASILDDYEYVTSLHENHRTFRLPSIYSFGFFDEKHERMHYLKIKRKWVSIGADYIVESETGVVGEIDGALIGLGYNAHVYVYEPTLAKNRPFVDLITLFATTVGFQSAMRRNLRRRLAAARRGMCEQNFIEDEEFGLLKNPRAAA